MEGRVDTPRLPHEPSLDGLRGLAVAAVLAFHLELGWARGGFLGVSLFFTLSGFLITALLLVERRATGRVGLRAFWARRARRLLPAAVVALAGIVAYGAAASSWEVEGLRGDVLAALGYVANWRFVAEGREYADLFRAPSPVQHFWSLAIEEQFYVVFPLLAAGALTLGRRWLGALLGGLAAASVIAMLTTSATARAYYGTDTRAAELLVGALLAVRLTGRPLGQRALRILSAAGPVALGVLVVAWATTAQTDGRLYDGGLALHALLVAVVLASAVHRGPLRQALAVRPLGWLGSISYGAYLYHWPLFLWLSPDRTGLDGAALVALRLAATLAAAEVSYRFIEQPVRRGRALHGAAPWVAAPAAAMALVASLVAVTAGPEAPALVFSPVTATAPPPPPTTTSTTTTIAVAAAPVAAPEPPPPPSPPVRIMVVGDSVATTLGRGLERWGTTSGRAVVWNVGRYWCGLVRGSLEGGYGGSRDRCDSWPSLWAGQVAEFQPDLVVVQTTIWDSTGRMRPEWGQTRRPGDPVFEEARLADFHLAVEVLSAGGADVVWLTAPCARDSSEQQVQELAGLNRALARVRGIRLLDLTGLVCPGGRFSPSLGRVENARPDGLHFSDPGADWLAERLGPVLVTPEPPPGFPA